MKKIFLFSLIFFPILLNSTCIVIWITPQCIYVVSDTRRVVNNSTNPTDHGTHNETIIKVHSVGVYNIAVSGFGDFQLRDSAMKALKNKTAKQSLYQTIQIFGNKFKPLYEKEMLLVKIYRPNDYKFHLKNDLGSVAFFAFENGLPIGYQCFFQMKDINNNPVISFSIVKIDTMAIVGAYDHIDNISDQEFVPYRKAIETNLIEGLKKLIRLEINEHPREVACPLDVFRLTITGMTRERDDCNLN